MRAMAHDPRKRIGNAADLQRQLEILMVQCNVYTTTVDVASYVAHQLHERAEARRRAVALGLEAAADRERIQKLLKPASLDSATGMMRLAEESRPAGREVVGLNDTGQNPHYDVSADALNASSASVNLIADDGNAPTRELAYEPVATHPPRARQAAYAPPPTLGDDPRGANAHSLGDSEQPSLNGATLGAAAVTFPARFAKIPAGKRQLLAAAFGVGAALLLAGAIATLASVISKPENVASGTDSARATPPASSTAAVATASPPTVVHARLETGVIGNVYADPSASPTTMSSTSVRPDPPKLAGSASEHRSPTGAVTTRATSPLLSPTTTATTTAPTRKTKTPDGF